MGKLQAAFPEIKEEKLKSVMFDLMLDIESGGVEQATIDRQPSVPRRSLPIDEEVADTPARSLVGEPVGWGDVAKSKPVAAEAAFDFEDQGNQPPAPPRPPVKNGRLTKEEKEARRREADEFTGLTDLEIARKLTDSQESKNKKTNGQFTNLGGEGPPGEEEFVVG